MYIQCTKTNLFYYILLCQADFTQSGYVLHCRSSARCTFRNYMIQLYPVGKTVQVSRELSQLPTSRTLNRACTFKSTCLHVSSTMTALELVLRKQDVKN